MGGPGILGLAPGFFPPGQLSIELVNVGGCLSHGDLALDSCAQFLAVAEHRFNPFWGTVGLGRVSRTTLPTGKGGVVHLFVVYGCQGAEEDADQLLLTDKLAEAQAVCIGQLMLIAGDLNADPAVILSLSKVFLLVGL